MLGLVPAQEGTLNRLSSPSCIHRTRNQLSSSQEAGPHKTQGLLAPPLCTFSLQDCKRSGSEDGLPGVWCLITAARQG